MDSDYFCDLFEEDQMIQDSSQESLSHAAANLDFCTSDEDDLLDNFYNGWPAEKPSSPSTDNGSDCQRAHSEMFNRSCTFEIQQSLQSCSSSIAADRKPNDVDLEPCISPLEKIRLIFAQLTGTLQAGKEPLTITLTSRRSKSVRGGALGPSATPDLPCGRRKKVQFPGRTAREGWRFSALIRILELIHEALRQGVTLSKREIYYRDPALFGSQAHVDRFVDDIACTLSVSRSDLNVTAVAKGLIAGNVTFTRRDGAKFSAAEIEGMLVPNLKDVLSADMSGVTFILVVEKEATFQSVAKSTAWESIAQYGILLTGKGYPDIATRAMLRFLSIPSARNGFATPNVFGLADFDPDGVGILSTYKHGSMALAHEGEDLISPSVHWLGLRSGHVAGTMAKYGGDHTAQSLLALTQRDRRRARKMLQWDVFNAEGDVAEWRGELQRMLMLGVKAELQLLDAVPVGLAALIQECVAQS